jgi:ureidoglycolate lyase
MSMFSCFPRELRQKGSRDGWEEDSIGGERSGREHLFDVTILERHPYTTQTFIPLDLSSKRSIQPYRDTEQLEPIYLVIVAPSLLGKTATAKAVDGSSVSVTDPPDLGNLQAFVARGGQAVTYGAGTWHAPMVVLGRRKVDFVVVQFANGVDGEDCQEVTIEDGLVVDVDVDVGLGGIAGLWPGGGAMVRSKL